MQSRSLRQSSFESQSWKNLAARWRLLHGGMEQKGVSIEFHDFAIDRTFEWSESFHEHTLEICLNLHGGASLLRGADSFQLRDNELAIYTVVSKGLRALRAPEGHHCFYTFEFSLDWLRRHLDRSLLKPQILRFLERPARARSYVEIRPLPPTMIPLRIDLLAPPVSARARDAWYFGKLFEVLSQTVFDEPAPTSNPERRNRERVGKARALLDRSFESPPSLKELGEEAGCSGYYLSRLFKEECGVSIPAYLRALRMEKGAEYLRKGRSVTETAIAVGYNNVSAFIEAFRQHHCTTPSRWVALWTEKRS